MKAQTRALPIELSDQVGRKERCDTKATLGCETDFAGCANRACLLLLSWWEFEKQKEKELVERWSEQDSNLQPRALPECVTFWRELLLIRCHKGDNECLSCCVWVEIWRIKPREPRTSEGPASRKVRDFCKCSLLFRILENRLFCTPTKAQTRALPIELLLWQY